MTDLAVGVSLAVTACAPHYLSVPEEARADRVDRIETPAFSVRPPAGSWILGGTTLSQDLFQHSESCVQNGFPHHDVEGLLDAAEDLDEPISELHFCRVSELLMYLYENEPEHVHWELSVYAFEDPSPDPTASAATRAERFLSRIRDNWTMFARPIGIEEIRIDGIAHYEILLEYQDRPDFRIAHCVLRFTPELVILLFSAEKPGPDRECWIVYESLVPAR